MYSNTMTIDFEPTPDLNVCPDCGEVECCCNPDDFCGCGCDDCECCYPSEPDDSMDGDAASALASAGHGTDEDYEHCSYDDFGGE